MFKESFSCRKLDLDRLDILELNLIDHLQDVCAGFSDEGDDGCVSYHIAINLRTGGLKEVDEERLRASSPQQ